MFFILQPFAQLLNVTGKDSRINLEISDRGHNRIEKQGQFVVIAAHLQPHAMLIMPRDIL